jgi:alpha-1,3-mannosyl-glycoprotein beta-1,2-N-acetylglucosaminyltransferase
LFFEKHLKYIKLSEKSVKFSEKDLSYLLKENYDKQFVDEVYKIPVVTFEELRQGLVKVNGPVRIQYNNRNQYKLAAKNLGIMEDFKVDTAAALFTQI